MMKDKNFEIAYIEKDGLYYPDLKLPTQTDLPIGKYRQMRLNFMRAHRKGTYTTLLMEGELNAYLARLNEEAFEMVDILTKQLAKQQGIDESLKAKDQLCWVRGMNNCKARAEEVVLREIIFR